MHSIRGVDNPLIFYSMNEVGAVEFHE